MEKNKKSRFKIQLLIFLGLFLLVEIILRLCGMHAGTIMEDFIVEENPEYVPRFVSDESGIDHIVPFTDFLIPGSKINAQGFRSVTNYTPEIIDSVRKSGKKIVMIIGDSFVEGCCPDNVSNSFSDLIGKSKEYFVLNFGVAGSDPLQYELIARKYIPQLKPDWVITVCYLGNDLLFFNRVPSPGVPVNFPFKNNKWLSSMAPEHRMKKANYTFKSAEEAYTFYLNNYTLKGSNRNFFEKAIGYSLILSKIYLKIEDMLAVKSWEKSSTRYTGQNEEIANQNFVHIKKTCDSLNTNCLFTAIAEPMEAGDSLKLNKKCGNVFKGLKWNIPMNIVISDYDGKTSGNHFHNGGHRKYADFLLELLNKSIKRENQK